MRFRVGREALGEAVAWVARALPSRPVVPVLAGLLLEAGDGLVLSCFDYEVSARVRLDADVAEPGTALVPGRLLAEITRSLPSQSAEFTSTADAVNLTCGSAEFMLVTLSAEDFPALPEPLAAAGTVDGGLLAAAAGQVVPAASRDDTLPMLTGVCMDFDGDAITLAATDRYRLAVREIPWAPADPAVRAAALVPARTLADVARTMAAGVPVTIAFGASGAGSDSAGATPRGSDRRGSGEPRPAEGMISFEGGGRRLTARLIAGEFIRYRSRFPAEFGCRAEVLAGPFTEAVRRVSLVAERASPVRLAFGSGVVVVEAQAEGRARAVETVAADFEGDEPVISFNPHYLLDGLGAVAVEATARAVAPPGDGNSEAASASSGRIRIEFTSPAKPALITWANDAKPAAGEQNGSADGERADPADGGRPDPADGGRPDPADGIPGAAGGRSGVPAFRYLVVPLRVPART
ncbi:MAG TPA: DNA polymerase III subunit beta [Streptosporangiaceae bacterium]|nr:DNA polymerase III subunit beta [Streptosporangiaceae bacterium]